MTCFHITGIPHSETIHTLSELILKPRMEFCTFCILSEHQ